MNTVTNFHVNNMKCEGCVTNVKKALEGVVGVEAVEVDLKAATATVKGNIDPQSVSQALIEAGYPAVVKSN